MPTSSNSDGQHDDTPSTPRNIFSSQPFRQFFKPYFDAGWFPIPLRERDKHPYSSGSTGRKNPLPASREDRVAMLRTLAKESAKGCNVGVRLSEDIIGIDIDNYDGKKGWTQYCELVNGTSNGGNGSNGSNEDGSNHHGSDSEGDGNGEGSGVGLGPLPRTYVSTARLDGLSGIRFFRLRPDQVGKFSWSGKAADHIDVIQHGHRYAVVAPSYHPDTKANYAWYSPDEWDAVEADADGSEDGTDLRINSTQRLLAARVTAPHDLPQVDDLPYLPDAWVEFLTRGYIAKTLKPIDMDSSYDEVLKWYKGKTDQGKACKQMKKRVASAKADIESRADSHDPLVAAHFSLIMAGIEGHTGSLAACRYVEKLWTQSVRDKEKRGPNEAAAEVFRSLAGSMRLAKGRVAELEDEGYRGVPRCTCLDLSELKANETSELGSIIALGPDRGETNAIKATGESDLGPGYSGVGSPKDYERNDVGNAQYLFDFTGGGNLQHVQVMKRFILWNGKKWQRDGEGGELTKSIFNSIQKRQMAYAISLNDARGQAEEAVALARQEKEGRGDGSIGDAQEALKAAAAKAKDWDRWANRSGSRLGINDCLGVYPALKPGVTSIKPELLDGDRTLLGVENGTIVLGPTGYYHRPAIKEDYVTLNTNQEYFPGGWEEIIRGGKDRAIALKMWEDYLAKFIPDTELRHFYQKVFGQAIGGHSKERIMVFLHGPTSTGKSTILRMVSDALGDYASSVSLGIFQQHKLNPAMGAAMTKRIVTASEISIGISLDEGIVKQVTGGDDKISVEYKGSNDLQESIFHATCIVATNVAPIIKGADAALFRRLCVLPFEEQIKDGDKANASFGNDFNALGGPSVILQWLLEGYQMYCEEGLDRNNWPERVKEASKSFGNSMSEVGEFFEERVIHVAYDNSTIESRAASAVPKGVLHDEYQRWATAQRIPDNEILSVNMFGKRVENFGFVGGQGRLEKGSTPTKIWQGMQITETDDGPVIKQGKFR